MKQVDMKLIALCPGILQIVKIYSMAKALFTIKNGNYPNKCDLIVCAFILTGVHVKLLILYDKQLPVSFTAELISVNRCACR